MREESEYGQQRPGRRTARLRLRKSWRLRAWNRSRAGKTTEALTLHRALVLLGPPRRPIEELRDRFRLLRWELAAGCWYEALSCVHTLHARLSGRGLVPGIAAGWVFLAQAAASFHLGASPRFRKSLASALREARRGRSSALMSAARRVRRAAARWSRQDEPQLYAADPEGEGCRDRLAFLEDALLDWFERLPPSHETGQEQTALSWSSLAVLVEGPEPAIALLDLIETREPASLAIPLEGSPDGPAGRSLGCLAGDRLLLRWLSNEECAEEERKRVPAAVIPLLARLVERRAPETDPAGRTRLKAGLSHLAARTQEPWARAIALESLAEVTLWLDPGSAGTPDDGRGPQRDPGSGLLQARADLALAAGFFQRVGWADRAAECERRWARLAWPSLGARRGEPAARVASASGQTRSLQWIRQSLLEAGFLTCDLRVLRDLSPLVLLAATPLPVLILGESGTGKEVLARALHRWSELRGEFVAIHCGAIPRDLLESELFGHLRGAFTGAGADKPGLVEAADNGTLFLDEIGEMGMDAQMKMLRVLESGEVRRLGDLRARRARIRLVAATHRDLEAAIRTGLFRLDLYHRVRGVTVRLRPLRERRGDIPLLAAHYLEQARTDEARLTLTESSMGRLLSHDWPGNVRELRAVILRATHLARALGRDRIHPGLLDLPAPPGGSSEDGSAGQEIVVPAAVSLLPDAPSVGGLPPKDTSGSGLEAILDETERRLILSALRECGWNRARAARSLGGLSRTTLISKMKRLGIGPHGDGDSAAGQP